MGFGDHAALPLAPLVKCVFDCEETEKDVGTCLKCEKWMVQILF